MDRFNSHEEIEFHSEAENNGVEARLSGKPMSSNPYDPLLDNWLYRSWNAGWCDADMDGGPEKSRMIVDMETVPQFVARHVEA